MKATNSIGAPTTKHKVCCYSIIIKVEKQYMSLTVKNNSVPKEKKQTSKALLCSSIIFCRAI